MNENLNTDATSNLSSELEERYISFRIGEEGYALEVSYVKEILGIQNITPMPQVPNYVKGVMNLRGKIIPVMDMRIRFGMPEIEWNRNTSIIVVKLDSTDVGIIVDCMNEVMDLAPKDLRYTKSQSSEKGDFLKGMADFRGTILQLIDLAQVLDRSQEITKVNYE